MFLFFFLNVKLNEFNLFVLTIKWRSFGYFNSIKSSWSLLLIVINLA